MCNFYFFLLQECPAGTLNEEVFKEIYCKFFPQGGKLTIRNGSKVFSFPVANRLYFNRRKRGMVGPYLVRFTPYTVK